MSTSFWDDIFTKVDEGIYNINPVLSLNDFKKHVSDGFEEKFNVEKLAFLLLNLEHVERLYREDARNKVSLEKYMSRHFSYLAGRQHENQFKVKYKQTTGDLCGRLQAEHSISGQGMVREARHVIFADDYLDIDVSNCHPVITEWICDNLGIECVALKRYIKERESLFKEISNYSVEHGGTSLERSYLKIYMLMISYGCGKGKINEIKEEHKHPFINEYVKCMREIGEKVMKCFPSFYKLNKERRIAKGKSFNYNGSGMSHLCQYVENQILLRMFKLLEENTVGVLTEHLNKTILCFDGLMIYKSLFSADFNKECFIQKCHDFFHSKGLEKFKLEVKEMDYHDKVLKSLEESGLVFKENADYLAKWVKQYHEDNLKKLKEYKNKFKYVGFYDTLDDEQQKILLEYMGSYGCKGDANLIRFDDFVKSVYKNRWSDIEELSTYVSAFCNRFIGKYYGSKKESFIMNIQVDKYAEGTLPDKKCFYHEWDEKKAELLVKNITFGKVISNIINDVKDYNNMIFHPYTVFQKSEADYKSFNTFIRYKAKLLKEEDVNVKLVQPWLDHILNVFVGGNVEHYRYFMKYFQNIFKYPRTKTRKVMGFVSNGQQVGGKGAFFIDLVEKLILGKGTAGVENGLSFFSAQFNGQLEKRVLTIAEECDSLSGNYHKTFEDLKSSVTQTSIDINVKHRDLRTVDDFNNYIVLSNNPYCVKVEEQDDRFVLFKTVDVERSKKVSYFNKLYKSVNQEVADHFYSYVCYMDLDDVSIRNSPVTNFYTDTQFRSLSSTSKFCVEVLDLLRGSNSSDEDEDEDEGDWGEEIDYRPSEWEYALNDKKIYIESRKKYRFIQKDLFDIYLIWCKENNMKNVAEKVGNFKTEASKYFQAHKPKLNNREIRAYTTIEIFEKADSA